MDEVCTARIKTVARAIARAHLEKITMGRCSDDDRRQFGVDWWHYFIREAQAALQADSDWKRVQNRPSRSRPFM